MSKPLKNDVIKIFSFLNTFFNSNGILRFSNLTPINQSTNMKIYIKTTKFSRKTVVSTPLNSTEAHKYAKFCLDETTRMFFIHMSSIGRYDKS